MSRIITVEYAVAVEAGVFSGELIEGVIASRPKPEGYYELWVEDGTQFLFETENAFENENTFEIENSFTFEIENTFQYTKLIDMCVKHDLIYHTLGQRFIRVKGKVLSNNLIKVIKGYLK